MLKLSVEIDTSSSERLSHSFIFCFLIFATGCSCLLVFIAAECIELGKKENQKNIRTHNFYL